METLTQAGAFEGTQLANGVEIHAPAWNLRTKVILNTEVVALLAELHRKFQPQRKALLAQRAERQKQYDAGAVPTYRIDENSEALTGDWQVNAIPEDLQMRRVEITGPVNSSKMVIQMLSRNGEGARADTAMLDFEDSMKPSWQNIVDGVHNVIGVSQGRLETVENGKVYRLDPEDQAVMMVRVRGLQLDESNIRIDGEAVSGGLLDLTLCWYHTAKELIARGKTPKYYIPKTEYHEEAAWWDEVFTALETYSGVPVGTLKATFLIETLPAAFQMEEILYAFRRHAAGMNVGRWDKIFSDIKILKNHPDRIMGDRATISIKPDTPWMFNYAQSLIKICHKRGAFAIGGMAAFTPGKTAELREAQTARVVADKHFENSIGHDGCWVSHPYFIGHALSQFQQKNQLTVLREDVADRPDLLPQGRGPYTLGGLRTNVRVGIGYQEGWNRDIGCVAWDNLMEDLATLEISRAQTWQWLKNGVTLESGQRVTRELIEQVFTEELAKINEELQEIGASADVFASFAQAAEDAKVLFTAEDFQPHLSLASDLVQDEA